tara:strand:+ start:275 stop:535 length:261 start_codon:yes stop_codon:yes gene_type:complete
MSREKPITVKELINKLKKFDDNMYITVNIPHTMSEGSSCISYLSNFGEPNFTNYVDIVLENKAHTTTQVESDCSKEIWNKTPTNQV